MSQLRKQKEKWEKIVKKITKLAVAGAILGLLAFGVFYLYQEFFAKKPPESFIPENPTSFVSINFKRTPDQEEIIKALEKRLGSENLFENTIKGMIFPDLSEEELALPEEEKIKSWLGEKIGVGHIYVSPTVSLSVFILELKNQDLAEKFLQTFSANLQKKGNVVSTKSFRNTEVTTVTGQTELAFAIKTGYLLISSRSDGIEKMIDVKDGRFSSLAKSRDYYLTKNKVKAKKALAFAYLDTFEFLKILYQATNAQDKDIFTRLEALKSKNYLGLSVIPQEDGLKITGFTKKEADENRESKTTKPFFDKKIPKDLIVSFEGKDLRPFLEDLLAGQDLKAEEAAKKELIFRAFELETGLNLKEDLFSLFGDQYSIILLPSLDKIEAGLIAKINSKLDPSKKLGKIEETTADLLNKYIIKDENKKVNFTEHSIKETKYRYLNLPDQYQVDIAYALLPDYLVLATSKETLENLLETLTGQKDALSQNESYQNALKKLSVKKTNQIIFVDARNLLKFANHYIHFDYEKLDKRIKEIDSLIISHEDKRQGSFFECFLKIK